MRWVRRLFGSERNAYKEQGREIRDRVRQLQAAAKTAGPASDILLLEVRKVAWDLAERREAIDAQITEGAATYVREGHFPPDIEEISCKLSMATCILDSLDKMRENALGDRNAAKIGAVAALHDQVMIFLGDIYFLQGVEDIAHDFLDLQADLLATARLCEVDVPDFDSMLMKHRNEIAGSMGERVSTLDNAMAAQ